MIPEPPSPPLYSAGYPHPPPPPPPVLAVASVPTASYTPTPPPKGTPAVGGAPGADPEQLPPPPPAYPILPPFGLSELGSPYLKEFVNPTPPAPD